MSGRGENVRINVWIAAAVLLVVIGTVVATCSYTQLQGHDVIFNQSSIEIDGHTYVAYEIIVDLGGKLAPKVVGEVGSVGTGVDFYLVNDSSWNSWSMNPASRSAFSMVHLNATAVGSQLSAENQFFFIPSATASYSAVFVNNEYPNASSVSVYATITIQYVHLSSVYDLIVGLLLIVTGFTVLIITALRKASR
jgi:hypothetical protein